MTTESAPVDRVLESDPNLQPDRPRPEQPTSREAIDAGVEEIRRMYGSNFGFIFSRLEEQVRHRLGLAARSAEAAALAGLMGVGVRLGLALVVTVLFGEWANIPWGRWAVIMAFYGWFDASQPWRTALVDVPPTPAVSRIIKDMTPLLSTIQSESDVKSLADFTRRWLRLSVTAVMGVIVTVLMLGAGWLFAPTGVSELHAGSFVWLVFLLYDFGAVMVFGGLFDLAFTARQARCDHRLFWPSPADSPEIRKAMQMWNLRALRLWITIVLALSLAIVPWDSTLVVPLATGFIAIGYLITLGVAFGDRASIRRLINRSRQRRLAVLRDRIDAFESHFADLSADESERLRNLLSLHNTIRDAPTTLTTTHTAARAAAGLILPTIMFIITVFGEVTAERFLDAVLP
jgi:hypothetical protein